MILKWSQFSYESRSQHTTYSTYHAQSHPAVPLRQNYTREGGELTDPSGFKFSST